MKIKILLLFIFITNHIFGQVQFKGNVWLYINRSSEKLQKDLAEEKAYTDSARFSKYHAFVWVNRLCKGGIENSYFNDSLVRFRNEKGQWWKSVTYNKHREVEMESLKLYNDSGDLVFEREMYPNKKSKSLVYIYTYNTNRKLIDASIFTGDSSKILRRIILKYDQAGNNIQQMSYIGRKLDFRQDYEYYDDGEKKRTLFYTSKGKLYFVMNYECKSTGVFEKPKQKDTTTVCVHADRDSLGRRMEIYEYTRDGKVFKSITFYDALDRAVEGIYYNHENKISSRWLNIYGNKGISKVIYYKKGGIKIRLSIEYQDAPSGDTYKILRKKRGYRLESVSTSYHLI